MQAIKMIKPINAAIPIMTPIKLPIKAKILKPNRNITIPIIKIKNKTPKIVSIFHTSFLQKILYVSKLYNLFLS